MIFLQKKKRGGGECKYCLKAVEMQWNYREIKKYYRVIKMDILGKYKVNRGRG